MKTIIPLFTLLLSIFKISFVFSQPSQIPNPGLTSLRNSRIAIGDINNNGYMDIVISGIDALGTYQTKVYSNNGNNTFSDLGVTILSLVDGDIALTDFNADNYLDIAICGRDASNNKFTKLYKNNHNNTFTELSTTFQGLYLGSLAWADYDNDGDPDLLICGQDASNVRKTIIYENKGNESFLEVSPNIPGVSRGQVTWGDINNDAYIDIMISGLNNSNVYITEIYKNNGDKTFTAYNANLQKLAFSSQQLIDYDNDGDLDLWISGNNSQGQDKMALYKNTNGNFAEVSAGFTALWSVRSAWGDYDADGDMDLIYTGLNGSSPTTSYYQNNGNNTFTLVNLGFTNLSESDVAWFDFNNDLKSDILLSGSSNSGNNTLLYRNNLASANSAPESPSSLNASVYGYSANLSWSAGNDAQTTASGLSYRICLGTSSGNYTILSPMADLVNGNSFLSAQGLVKANSTWLKNLTQGRYFWRVQSVDASSKASTFSSESSFAICDPINLGNDREMCTNAKLLLSAGETDDEVNWYSEKNGLIAANSKSLSYTITQTDKFRVEIIKSIGCTSRDTLLVSALPLPSIELPATDQYCFGSTLKYEAGLENEIVKWYKANGSLLNTGHSLEYKVVSNEVIKCEITGTNQCIDSAKINISSLNLPQVSLGEDYGVCKGQTAHLQVNGMKSVNWYALPSFLMASNNSQIDIEISRDTTIRAEFTDANNCSNADTIHIYSNLINWINAGNDTIICYNTSMKLGGKPTVKGGTSPFQYNWLNGNNTSFSNEENPIVTPTENTVYTLNVIDNNGCAGSDQIVVNLNPKSQIDPGSNASICYGDNVRLGGQPTAQNSLFAYTYKWFPEDGLNDPLSANPVATPMDTTTYRLIVGTGACSPDTVFVTVTVFPLPVVEISDDTSIGYGSSTTLLASGGLNYEWTPVDGLQNPNSAETEASPESTTTYKVTVSDENNCHSQAAVTISVLNDLFIPNLFTPNGDGNNDSFKIYGIGINEFNIIIYNRSGNIVFENNDINYMLETGWDGTSNGVKQAQGSYLYVISGRFADGSLINYNNNRGTINLMR